MSKLVNGSTCKVPMSNISYVNENEFKAQVEELKSKFDVSVLWINHKGENGKKDHRHYLLKSNGTGFSNVNKVKQIMYEYDTDGNKIEGKVFAQCKSLGDYYYYILHNPQYLEYKGEKREITYNHEDIKGDSNLISDCQVCSEEITFEDRTFLNDMKNGILSGENDFEIISRFGKYLKPTEIGLALNSVNKLRKALDGESANLFFRQMAQYVNFRLTTDKKVATSKIEMLMGGGVVDICDKMQALFDIFISKIDNDILDLILN